MESKSGETGLLAVDARRVSKRYGRITALEGFELRLTAARTLALVGESGAGKSNALAILAGAIEPTAGDVRIFGERPSRSPAGLGALLDGATFPQGERVGAFLRYLAKLQFVVRPAEEAAATLARVEGSAWEGLKFRDLSREQQRLLAIAQAFMGRPRLVLLDDPMTGLGGSRHGPRTRHSRERARTHERSPGEPSLRCDQRPLRRSRGARARLGRVAPVCARYDVRAAGRAGRRVECGRGMAPDDLIVVTARVLLTERRQRWVG